MDKRETCIKFMEIIDEWGEECGFEIPNNWGHELAQKLFNSLPESEMEVKFISEEYKNEITKRMIEEYCEGLPNPLNLPVITHYVHVEDVFAWLDSREEEPKKKTLLCFEGEEYELK